MLWNGRMELWGNFDQSGNIASFASSENFVIVFMGSEQKAYFDDAKNSGFANIDSVHGSVKIIDYAMILEESMSFRISRGILTGLRDALGILELSDAAVALIATLGISLAASMVIMPEVVANVIGMIIGIIGVVNCAFTIVAATRGIYSTAMGTESKYDKTEDFAHDATMLVVSLIGI